MVFIKLRGTNTPTKDFLIGIKKASGITHHKVRRAFAGTKLSRNPNLSLSKQEVSKAIARFQKKTEKNLTKAETKDLEDFLNKRYKSRKKETVQKNIDRQRDAEKEDRGKDLHKALGGKEGGKAAAKDDNFTDQGQVRLSKYSPLQKPARRNTPRRVPTGPENKQCLSPQRPSQPPKKEVFQEPEDLPID